jgi:hypothetical protein
MRCNVIYWSNDDTYWSNDANKFIYSKKICFPCILDKNLFGFDFF